MKLMIPFKRPRESLRTILLIAVIAFLANKGYGDKIKLRTGKEIEGQIVEENDKRIRVSVNGNILVIPRIAIDDGTPSYSDQLKRKIQKQRGPRVREVYYGEEEVSENRENPPEETEKENPLKTKNEKSKEYIEKKKMQEEQVQAQEESEIFLKHLKDCSPYQQETEHPLSESKIVINILGPTHGECHYTLEAPEGTIDCYIPMSNLSAYSQSGNLQQSLLGGTCTGDDFFQSPF